jgi:hypothetical protein
MQDQNGIAANCVGGANGQNGVPADAANPTTRVASVATKDTAIDTISITVTPTAVATSGIDPKDTYVLAGKFANGTTNWVLDQATSGCYTSVETKGPICK